jgi:hypothetical protein
MRAALTVINVGLSVTDGAAPPAGGGGGAESEGPR